MATKPKKVCCRLVSKYDWSIFIDYFSDEPLQQIFDRLDNYSLFLLHEHFYGLTCDVFLTRKGFYYKCCEIIKIIANSRNFKIWEKPPQDLSLMEVPLKRYEDESWINHPNESL